MEMNNNKNYYKYFFLCIVCLGVITIICIINSTKSSVNKQDGHSDYDEYYDYAQNDEIYDATTEEDGFVSDYVLKNDYAIQQRVSIQEPFAYMFKTRTNTIIKRNNNGEETEVATVKDSKNVAFNMGVNDSGPKLCVVGDYIYYDSETDGNVVCIRTDGKSISTIYTPGRDGRFAIYRHYMLYWAIKDITASAKGKCLTLKDLDTDEILFESDYVDISEKTDIVSIAGEGAVVIAGKEAKMLPLSGIAVEKAGNLYKTLCTIEGYDYGFCNGYDLICVYKETSGFPTHLTTNVLSYNLKNGELGSKVSFPGGDDWNSGFRVVSADNFECVLLDDQVHDTEKTSIQNVRYFDVQEDWYESQLIAEESGCDIGCFYYTDFIGDHNYYFYETTNGHLVRITKKAIEGEKVLFSIQGQKIHETVGYEYEYKLIY